MSRAVSYRASCLMAVILAAVPSARERCAAQEAADRPLSVLTRAVTERVTGGALGLIARGDSVIELDAVGDRAPGVPMSSNTITRLASITKPVTATAVLMLVERGQLSLRDPVDRWFPGFGARVATGKGTVRASRKVTVLDLLTHQAGLATDGPEVDALGNAPTAQAFARAIGALPLKFQPGTRFEYGCCGSAYEVLGAIVARVSGRSLNDFVTKEILHPLRMNATYYVVPEDKQNRLAQLYRKDSAGVLRAMAQREAPTSFYSGAGGLRSTITDYFRLVRFLLHDGELDGTRLLRPGSVRSMVENHIASGTDHPGYGWGYGVEVKTSTAPDPAPKGAFGWNGGTGTSFVADPAANLVVILFAPTWPGTEGIDSLRTAYVDAAYAAYGSHHQHEDRGRHR